jgi:predicted ATPase/DNA-binding XRE family transcriptional regulator
LCSYPRPHSIDLGVDSLVSDWHDSISFVWLSLASMSAYTDTIDNTGKYGRLLLNHTYVVRVDAHLIQAYNPLYRVSQIDTPKAQAEVCAMEPRESFGYWVRRRRKALDLTQEELAQCVGCALVSLRKIEGDERRPSAQMAERLALCLGVPPSSWPRFVAAAVGEQPISGLDAPALAARLPGNVPAAVSSLVGRQADILTVTDRLQQEDVRLVTITGPVGVGKTQLALAVGRRLRATFRDSVYLVSLTGIRDPERVPATVAGVFGVRERRDGDLVQLVVDSLAPRALLLIVDNFEHLLPAAPFLEQLLGGCPSLRLLVTSRARLHLYGEHEYALAPLPLPEPDDIAAAADSPAVQLFCARARAARTDFQLTPSLTPAIVALCRQLDGLPLAIELAAARSRLFSPPELQQHLAHRLTRAGAPPTEVPARLQALENAIAWSFGLLPPAQQMLLARLAVFAGGFSLPAAEAVCVTPPAAQAADDGRMGNSITAELADGIDVLLDQSLLQCEAKSRTGLRDTTGAAEARSGCTHCPLRVLHDTIAQESRFTLLETIREFALDRLAAAGELTAVRRRHALYFVGWAEQADRELCGPDQVFWLASLERNNENLRAALHWLLTNRQGELCARLACALGVYWQRHGHYSEGRAWLRQVLALLDDPPVPELLRARTLQTAATLAYRQGDWEVAQQWLAECRQCYADHDDRGATAHALFDLGWIAIDRADWDESLRLNSASLALAREAGDPLAVYKALTNLGWTHLCMGQNTAAGPLFDEAYGCAQRVGHTRGIAVSLANLAWIAHYQGDMRQTAALAQESLRLCCQLGESELEAECLELLAIAAVAKGQTRRAAQLSGAAEHLRASLHIVRPPTHHAAVAHTAAVADMRTQLGEAELMAAWRQGSSLRTEELLVFVLGCGRPAKAAL